MKALALDFDGVIADSAREAFVVALRVYLELRPGSSMGELAARVEMRLRQGEGELLEEEAARAFLQLMPLGNRAEDFGVALSALDAQVDLPGQAAYDAFYATHPPDWRSRFHRRFYEVRAAFRAADETTWLRLQPPYPGVAELLRRHASEVVLAVATAKDRVSVRRLLARYGILELFRDDLVLDKEAGVSKTAHLTLIRERAAVDWPELTFLDDKVNHLDDVAPLGVRCALACWGYNSERERAEARSRGFLVCTLGDVEQQLFGR
jgi:phosphoglycolate phosphatase-like HAD superfamily hydrolase